MPFAGASSSSGQLRSARTVLGLLGYIKQILDI